MDNTKLCRCKHPEIEHSERGCLHANKNKWGINICKCRKFETSVQEIKNDA